MGTGATTGGLESWADLMECSNWRGKRYILAVAAKILGRIIITRIWDGVDSKLHQEQAGFRKRRGTVEQIFILRNIIEQCIERNSNSNLCFRVGFEKVFDNVDWATLWRTRGAMAFVKRSLRLRKLCKMK